LINLSKPRSHYLNGQRFYEEAKRARVIFLMQIRQVGSKRVRNNFFNRHRDHQFGQRITIVQQLNLNSACRFIGAD